MSLASDSRVITEIPPGCERDVYEALVTGFGPFQQHTENASWLAVQPLRGRLLRVDPEEYGYDPEPPAENQKGPPKSRIRYLRISTILVPMEYEEVLDIIPGLHSRPPRLPKSDSEQTTPNPPPPKEGYDLMFHVGVTGRGALRMEKIAHKLGYNMKDRLGNYAPTIAATRIFLGDLGLSQDGTADGAPDGDDSDSDEPVSFHIGSGEPEGVPQLLPQEISSPAIAAEQAAHVVERPTRGVTGYDTVSEELYTNIDVSTMITDMKSQGVTQIYSSMDAGHYLCDFLFYTSLAEARRKRTGSKGRNAYQISKVYDTQNQGPHQPHLQIPVLCMHCPPVDKPLAPSEVTDAIQKMLTWVVAGM